MRPILTPEEMRELEARGWWLPHDEPPEKYWEIVRDSGGWFDPFHDDFGRGAASERADGRIALFPEPARRRIAGGVPGLAGGFLPLGLGWADEREGQKGLRMGSVGQALLSA